jgi:YD repeat-containing protein
VTTSIAIVRVEAPKGATLESITRSGQRNLRKAYGKAGVTGPPVAERLDGERALRLDYDAEEARIRQVGALRAGHFYLVSFTAARSSFDRRVADFDALLRSWRWQSGGDAE